MVALEFVGAFASGLHCPFDKNVPLLVPSPSFVRPTPHLALPTSLHSPLETVVRTDAGADTEVCDYIHLYVIVLR